MKLSPQDVVGIRGEPPTPRQPSSKVRVPSPASSPFKKLCAGMSEVTCRMHSSHQPGSLLTGSPRTNLHPT